MKTWYGWRALCLYAVASLQHTLGAGRWDDRAFPERAKAAEDWWSAVIVDGDDGDGSYEGNRQGWNWRDGNVTRRQTSADAAAVRSVRRLLHDKDGSSSSSSSVPIRDFLSFVQDHASIDHMLLRQQQGADQPGRSDNEEKENENDKHASNEADNDRSRCRRDPLLVVTVAATLNKDTNNNNNDDDGKSDHDDGHGGKLSLLIDSAAAAGPCVELLVLEPLPRSKQQQRQQTHRDNPWYNDWKPRLLLSFLRSSLSKPKESDRNNHRSHFSFSARYYYGSSSSSSPSSSSSSSFGVWDDRLLLFVDGFDVLLSPAVASLGDRLSDAKLLHSTRTSSTGHRKKYEEGVVVFAAEQDCWPDAAMCRWMAQPIGAVPEPRPRDQGGGGRQGRGLGGGMGFHGGAGGPPYGGAPFLNAGVFAGGAGAVRAMLEAAAAAQGALGFCGEDQRTYQRWAWDHPYEGRVDRESDVFQCMHGHSWEVDFDVEGEGEGGDEKDEKGEDEKDENYAQVMVNALSVGLESNKRRTPKEETTRTRTRTRKRTTTIVLQETTTPDESSGVAAVPIGPPKTPLVLHFNSHDGKGMMHDVGEALKARRGGK